MALMEQTSQELGRPTEGEGREEHKLHFGQVKLRHVMETWKVVSGCR